MNNITVSGALSTGALSISIFSGLYFNHKINNIEELINQSDAKLCKLIRYVNSNKNNKIIDDKLEDYRQEQSRSLEQIRELLDECQSCIPMIEENSRTLKRIQNFLRDNGDIDDNSKIEYSSQSYSHSNFNDQPEVSLSRNSKLNNRSNMRSSTNHTRSRLNTPRNLNDRTSSVSNNRYKDKDNENINRSKYNSNKSRSHSRSHSRSNSKKKHRQRSSSNSSISDSDSDDNFIPKRKTMIDEDLLNQINSIV